MSKRMWAAAMLASCLTVAGCGSSGGGADSANKDSAPAQTNADAGASASEQPKVTLTVQYEKSDDKAYTEQMDKKVERFKQAYPNVEIKKDVWAYNPSEIGIKMAANQAPSFYNTWATEGKVLVQNKWAAEVGPLMADYAHKDDFDPNILEPFTIDGKLYAVPKDGYVLGIVINKKLFADKNVAVPSIDWTWDDFAQTAGKLADKSKGIAGFVPMAKGNEGGWQWTNFLFAAGGDIEKVDGDKVTAVFNSDAGVKALDLYKKLRWDYDAVPQNWALNGEDASNLFKQGRAAMMIGNTGTIKDIVNQTGMDKNDLTVLPFPAVEQGSDQYSLMGGNYYVINPQKSPEEQQMAFNFIVFDYFQDSSLTDMETNLEEMKKNNEVEAPNLMNYYKPDSEYAKKISDLQAKYDNVLQIDPNILPRMKGKPEAPYNGQDYYALMTLAIQTVFTDKNADVKALMDKSAEKLQTEYLDKLTK